MNLDDNHLTTVQATVEKTSGGKPVINLLKPFLPGPVMARSRTSYLKLLSGNEGGISLSVDGNQLTIDLEYYNYLSPGDSEALYYEYRINQPDTPHSKHTAMITILATEGNDFPTLHEAILTTDQPFDHSAYEEQLSQNAITEIVEDEQMETLYLEPEPLEIAPDNETEIPQSEESFSENKKKFSFSSTNPADDESSRQTPDDDNKKTTLNYEDLMPAPEPEISSLQPDEEKGREDRSKEIDQAIAEADQLLEATLGIQQEDTPTSTDSSPEQALERLINQIPDDQAHIQGDEPEPEAETALEIIIDELSTITDKRPDASPNLTTATRQKATFLSQPQKQETLLTSLDTYIFNLEDFDQQAGITIDKLESIKLNTLPSAGKILYNRELAQAGQKISRVDLLTGRLTFKPDEHFADRGNSQFFFSPCYLAEYSSQQLFKLNYLKTGEPTASDKEEVSQDVSMEIDITADNGTSVLASGNMTIKGKDSALLEITAGTLTGAYGSFTVNSNGYWTYSLDKNQPAILDLRGNNCLSEHLVIKTEQSCSHGILLTIICRNKQVDILVSQSNS